MPQPALHPVPHHRAAHPAAHHKPNLGAPQCRSIGSAGVGQVDNDRTTARPAAPLHRRREVLATGQSGDSGQQCERFPNSYASGGQFGTALAPPGRDDGPTGTGAHAQAEPVGPRAATVVRLERTLALAHGCRSPGAVVRVAMGEGAQECPPLGGRRAEPKRPVAAPSKPASGVTVRATRRYIGGACLHGVLVAVPQVCSRAAPDSV